MNLDIPLVKVRDGRSVIDLEKIDFDQFGSMSSDQLAAGLAIQWILTEGDFSVHPLIEVLGSLGMVDSHSCMHKYLQYREQMRIEKAWS